MQEARQLKQTTEGGGGAGEVAAAAAGRHQVDLDSLAFPEGSHQMESRDCKLPPNSYRTSFKVGPTLTVSAVPTWFLLMLFSHSCLLGV